MRRRQFLGGFGAAAASFTAGFAPASGLQPAVEAAAERLSVSEIVMYSTVQILTDTSTGTGFFHSFFKSGTYQIPALVTAHHVIAGANACRFFVPVAGPDGSPSLTEHVEIRIADLGSKAIKHPACDLAIIPVHRELSAAMNGGKWPFHTAFEQELIPTNEDLGKLTPVESIVTLGYPGRTFDDSKLPIFHRGSTASSPAGRFRGKRRFIIDFATWPGASGSPVLKMDIGGYFDQRTGLPIQGHRLLLLGVVVEVATQEVPVQIFAQIPPGQTYSGPPLSAQAVVPTNLGICESASRILEFEPLLLEHGATAPPGYRMRTSAVAP